MTFGEAIRKCLARYADFSGRASRPEYWWFILFVWLVSLALGILDTALFSGPMMAHRAPRSVLSGLWQLAMLLPVLAAGWRRLHDTGRSGLYLFFPLLVTVAASVFLMFWTGVGLMTMQARMTDFALPLAGTLGAAGILAVLAAIIAPLLVLWWLTQPSEPGPNRFGPHPGEVTP